MSDYVHNKQILYPIKEEYLKEEEMIKGQIDFIQNSKEKSEKYNEWVDTLIKYKNIKHLDRETIAEILDKIIVTGNDDELNIEIVFKFKML